MPYSLQKVCGYYFYLLLGCVHEQWRVVRWSLRFKVLIPEDLKVLTICGCNYKGSTFSSLTGILRPWLLVRRKSNSRPSAWKPDAQPTEPQVSSALNFTFTVGEIMMPLKHRLTSMNEVQLHQESGLYKYPMTQDFLFLQGTEKWLESQKPIIRISLPYISLSLIPSKIRREVYIITCKMTCILKFYKCQEVSLECCHYWDYSVFQKLRWLLQQIIYVILKQKFSLD